MRTVIQRALDASVTIEGKVNGKIDKGLVILVGIEDADSETDVAWLSRKIVNLRIFDDENGVMNKSLLQTGGDILLISQFTLHAQTAKGNRPSYIRAARHEKAIPLYESFIKTLEKDLGKPIQTGIFGSDMKVRLTNDGPVTIIIDTQSKE